MENSIGSNGMGKDGIQRDLDKYGKMRFVGSLFSACVLKCQVAGNIGGVLAACVLGVLAPVARVTLPHCVGSGNVLYHAIAICAIIEHVRVPWC